MTATDIDPITLEVVQKGLESIADEMALVIMRSAFSPVVRDTMDYSTALCDANGDVIAQSLTLPVQLGAFPDMMKIILDEHLDDIDPGDMLIANDPYGSGGQHLPDIYIIAPIFFDGVVEGWAATMAHHCDVGGLTPGSLAIHARDIFQEGLQIPLVKLLERGVESNTMVRILEKNSRNPRDLMGDIHSQVAACRVAERGYLELVQRHSPETLRRYSQELLAYSEHLMRETIANMPDGTYRFTDYIDGLGGTPAPLAICVAVTVSGRDLVIDFEGTAEQVEAAINAPIPIVHSATYCAIRSVMDGDVPNNEGYMRPIEIRAPLGTLVNPRYPGACAARGVIAYRVFDAIMGALFQVLPEKVIAAGEGGPTLVSIGGYDGDEPYVVTEVMVGCWGARASRDGLEGAANPAANLSNQPVELVEAQLPLRINEYGMVADSGGPGRYRGGLAFVREFEIITEEAQMTIRADRRDHPPYGLDGGQPGRPSQNLLQTPDAGSRILPTMPMESYLLKRGSVFRHTSAGGGGFGDPFDRDPSEVREDALDGKVTRGGAERDYGVILTEGLELDLNTTNEERKRRISP